MFFGEIKWKKKISLLGTLLYLLSGTILSHVLNVHFEEKSKKKLLILLLIGFRSLSMILLKHWENNIVMILAKHF